MDQLTSKAQLLEVVRQERKNIERVVEETGEARMEQPGVTGEWSMKDVLAHLTGWRQRSVARMEAAAHGGEPETPWPASLDEEEDLDDVNRWFYERNRDRPLADVLRDSRESFDRLEAAIAALPDEKLFDTSRYAWTNGAPIGPAVIRGTHGHFHDEHEADIRAWLSRSGSA